MAATPSPAAASPADALELFGALSRRSREYDDHANGIFPIAIRGKYQQRTSHYALRAVAMIRAGVAPDPEAEVSWWSADDRLV